MVLKKIFKDLGGLGGRRNFIFHSDTLSLLEASSGSKFENTSLRTDRLLTVFIGI